MRLENKFPSLDTRIDADFDKRESRVSFTGRRIWTAARPS